MKDGAVHGGKLIKREGGYVWFQHAKFGKTDVYVYAEGEVAEVSLITIPAPRASESDGQSEPVEGNRAPNSTPSADSRIAQAPAAAVENEEVAELGDKPERVREQWRELAPHLSMKNQLYLLDVTPAILAETFSVVRDLQAKADRFDAHPDLQAVGPDLMRFLVQAETRIMPCIRANVGLTDVFTDPEGSLFAALGEMTSRHVEQMVLFNWQRDYDDRIASDYERMMPLVRALAAKPDGDSRKLLVTGGGGGLQFVNNFPHALSDITIIASFETLDGRSSLHYFYVPRLSAGEVYDPRASADWSCVGLSGTTGGWIKMYSNEASSSQLPFQISENVGNAVRGTLSRLCVTSPGTALRGLNKARIAAPQSDLATRKLIVELVERAKDNKAAATKRIRWELARLQDELNGKRVERNILGQPVRRAGNPPVRSKEVIDAHRKHVKKLIERKNQELRELNGG